MLAYMLGRNPSEFGLVPDARGFVRLRELLQALHEEEGFRHVREADLRAIPLCHPSADIEIEENRIRCRSLASSPAEEHLPAEPPRLLYAAIRRRAWPFVHQKGLAPERQAPAILCIDRDFALRLGRRIDPEPVILSVDVRQAAAAGVRFLPLGEGLFQAAAVPPSCLSGPALPESPPSPTGRQGHPPASTRILPGGYLPDPARVFAGEAPRNRSGGKRAGKRPPHGRWKREKPPWKESAEKI